MTPDSPDSPPAAGDPLPRVATALLSTRPHWLVSLLGLLAAVSAILALALGMLAFADFLPPAASAYVGAAALILAALQKAVNHAGDLLDDGQMNNSFGAANQDQGAPLMNQEQQNRLPLLPLIFALGFTLGLTGCAGGIFSAGVSGQYAGQNYQVAYTVPVPAPASLPSPAKSGKEAKSVTPNPTQP